MKVLEFLYLYFEFYFHMYENYLPLFSCPIFMNLRTKAKENKESCGEVWKRKYGSQDLYANDQKD